MCAQRWSALLNRFKPLQLAFILQSFNHSSTENYCWWHTCIYLLCDTMRCDTKPSYTTIAHCFVCEISVRKGLNRYPVYMDGWMYWVSAQVSCYLAQFQTARAAVVVAGFHWACCACTSLFNNVISQFQNVIPFYCHKWDRHRDERWTCRDLEREKQKEKQDTNMSI